MDTAERSVVPAAGSLYDGFISYSHAADDLLAPRLQAGLQRFAKPWWKRRALRVFRDESSLAANPHLWSSIVEALDTSDWFVLLLSPDAATSPWVNQEIDYWKTHKESSHILPVLTDGTFDWDGSDVVGTAVPPGLTGVFAEEPRWVDLRFAREEEQLDLKDPRFADAVADVASALRGVPKDELASEEVKQHRRTLRTAWGAAALVGLLAVAAIVFGIQSANNAQRAEAEAARAEQEADRAAANAEAEAEARAEAEDAAAAEVEARQLAQGRALLSSARVKANEDVELALLLALEGAEHLGPDNPDVQEVIHGLLMVGTTLDVLDVPGDALSASFAVDVAPHGKLVAATAAGNQLTLFDAETYEPVATLGAPLNDISSAIPGIDFSSDGSQIAAVGTDGIAHIWEIQSGEVIWEADTGESDAGFARFAADDQILITSVHSRTAWDVSSGEPLWVNDEQVQSFGGAPIDVDRTGSLLAWVNKISGEVVAVDVFTGERQWTIEEPVPTFVDFHPALDVVLTKPQEFQVRIHDYGSGAPVELHSFTAYGPSAVAFSSDGSRFVVASEHESLVFNAFDAADPSLPWEHIATIESGAALPLGMAFVSPDRVAIAQPGRAAVWGIEPQGELHRLDTGSFHWGIAGVPDSSLALAVVPGFVGGNSVFAYDLATGEIAWESSAEFVSREPLHGGAVRVLREDLAFGYLPHVDALATFDPRDGRVIQVVADLSGGEPNEGEPAPISVDIDPTGRFVASAVFDTDYVTVWELGGDGGERLIDVAEVDGVYAVALGPGGEMLAAGGDDGVVLVDLSADGPARELDARGLTAGLAFSPDGSLLAAADDTFGFLYVFETNSGERIADIPLPGAQMAEFTDDGSELIVAAAQSGLVSFDTTTWTRRWSIPRELLTGALLWSDLVGDEVVAMETTGVIHQLTLEAERLLDTARTRIGRSFTALECATFRIDPCPTLEEMRSR